MSRGSNATSVPRCPCSLPRLRPRLRSSGGASSPPKNLPDIRDLLEEGLLGDSELDEIWGTTPKTDVSSGRVDFDGFCEAFARVDALFEEEEEQVATDASREEISGETPAATAGVTEDGAALESVGVESSEGTPSTPEEVFVQIVGSKTGLLDFEGLLRYVYVCVLLE